MKKLILLRPGHEALEINIERVDTITGLDYPAGILKIRLSSGEYLLGYMIKFE